MNPAEKNSHWPFSRVIATGTPAATITSATIAAALIRASA
jgi:hypothetical protein